MTHPYIHEGGRLEIFFCEFLFVWTVVMIYVDLLPFIIVELFLLEYKVEKNIINNICQLGEQVVLPLFFVTCTDYETNNNIQQI